MVSPQTHHTDHTDHNTDAKIAIDQCAGATADNEVPLVRSSNVKTSSTQMSPRTRLWRRLFEPVGRLLHQGASPNELARALALGCATGTSPLIGTTTATGAFFALLLRLNPVACLSANYAVYPLQVALVLPFAKVGGRLTGWQNLPINPSQIKSLFQNRGFDALETLGSTLANASLAWLLCTPIIFSTTYFLSYQYLQRWQRRAEDKQTTPPAEH